MLLEIPPFPLKTNVSFNTLHTIESCAVAVVYCIYDKKKKKIVSMGTSRACGENHNKISIHAEQKCIEYCRSNDKRHKYEFYIWRYTKDGRVKPVFCCGACIKLLEKFKYHNKIYTFEDNQICPAIGRPYVTLGHQMKNQL
tara:strand:- start:2352 stop:2774 length:423 start_codon:yes stop_codon:yes gene_type:complete